MVDRIFAIVSIGAVSIVSLLLFFSHKKSRGKQCGCRNRVKNKVIAITGSNRGIEFGVALQLASYGARVYLCGQSEGEEAVSQIRKQLNTNQIYFVSLNLCSFKSCNECVALFQESENKLDILIHIGHVFHAVPELTEDGFEEHYQANFLAPVLLTENLLPLLFESANPRVIFNTPEALSLTSYDAISSAYFRTRDHLPSSHASVNHDGISKLGLKLYAGFLAETDKTSPFVVASVDAGDVRQSIGERDHWYSWPKVILRSLLMGSPKDGVQSFIHAANAKDINNACYISDCDEVFPFLTPDEISAGKELMVEVFSILNIT